jgi:NADPH-dependent glutamate synthase beta subunit-like oxidoreductase
MGACSSSAALDALLHNDADQPHYVPPPCQVACPIGTDVASYVGYIWLKDYEGALEAITATNPLSGVCGRVCDAPCEPACRRAGSDGTVTIRALKRFVMDKLGATWNPPMLAPSKAKSVAIVGSGPAGLTAAQDIAQAGYHVHLYEGTSKAGGVLTWGIPDFRLPPEVVEQDIRHVLQRYPGIELHLSTPLGEAVSLGELATRHDAVLLATGANAGKKLGVPGDGLPGVIDGVTFLARVNGGARPTMPETVLVIGGGDVAMDACRVARRLPGVKSVRVLYRRGPHEIPARKHELEAAIEEGIEIVYNVQPVAVTEGSDGETILRVQKTRLGDPGPDGRRRPIAIDGEDEEIAAGLIIASVGQKSLSRELERCGLMADDKIETDPVTMRTRMARVYAAGDGAFGPSTIVNAMGQGHRAAYYVIAQLEGIDNPKPYATPNRTRSVPVAQDPLWEKLPVEHPHFLGLGEDPQAFAESEANYTEQSAMEQAARCYRCDTETGSADYSVKLRETIFEMVNLTPLPQPRAAITRTRLVPREDPFPAEHRASFDDLTFVPANLSRLVIDPYREGCKTRTLLGAGGIILEQALLVGGFDAESEPVKAAVAAGIAAGGGGYVGRTAIAGNIPWLQLLHAREPADAAAAAAVGIVEDALFVPTTARDGQVTGLCLSAGQLEAGIPYALEQGIGIVVLDASRTIDKPWPELSTGPDLSLITEAVALLRAMNAEEGVDLVYFGGIRSGTDLAKALSLGAIAGIAAVAPALAMGGEIGAGGIVFPPLATPRQRTDAVANYLKAASSEVSMMARCTGKTNIHNLEPEDLRSLTLAAERATGIIMAGLRRTG